MLIIGLIYAAAAAVWLVLLIRALGVYGGGLSLLVLASCFGYEFYHQHAGPLPITADRAFLVILVGLYAVQRTCRILPGKRLGTGDWLFGGFLLYLAASTLTHDWRWRSSLPLAHLLFLYVLPALVYWLMRGCVINERRLQAMFGVLALFGVYLGLTAMAEVSGAHALVMPRFIVASEFREWLGRGRGPFLNPNTNGMYLSAAAFAWTMFWPRAGRLGRSGVLFGLAITLAGIGCTLTRSCWLGAAAGIAVIVLAALPWEKRIPTLLYGAVVGLLVLTVGGDSWKSFKRDVNVSEYHMEQSARLRPILAAVAWRMFQDYPVLGCGYGQYKRHDVDYLRDPTSDLPLEEARKFVQHNLFLAMLVETGLIGLALYVSLLTYWAWQWWRMWARRESPLRQRQMGLFALVVLLQWVINGIFHDVAIQANSNLLLLLVAGIAEGARRSPDAPTDTLQDPLPNQTHSARDQPILSGA